MNHNDLSKKISSKLYLRRSFSKRVLNLIYDEITQELQKGNRVYLRALGAFHSIERPARRYYDPKTKKIKTKPEHKDIKFNPAKNLLKKIKTKKTTVARKK